MLDSSFSDIGSFGHDQSGIRYIFGYKTYQLLHLFGVFVDLAEADIPAEVDIPAAEGHNLVAVGEVRIQPVVVDNLEVCSLVDLLNR